MNRGRFMNIIWNRDTIFGYRVALLEVDGVLYHYTAFGCQRVGVCGSYPNGTQVLLFGGLQK